MSRKRPRVRYQLDSGDIRNLTDEEIKAILRAADELIAAGGRSMLAKILKGSKDKKGLEHSLDQCPVYGYYGNLTLSEITNRIDWMIKRGYLEIEYNDRLPILIFSERGWEIEREAYAEKLLQRLRRLLEGKEVYALFLQYIESAAERANKRKEYQRVCAIIRNLKSRWKRAGIGNKTEAFFEICQ